MRYIKTEDNEIFWNRVIENEKFVQSLFDFCDQDVRSQVAEFIEGKSRVMSMTINNKEHTLIK